uniref:Putative secreted protein n=1 Tax=Anopheles marajoara TaxID=58244 RepID=A0A2M4C8B9_9DIPT
MGTLGVIMFFCETSILSSALIRSAWQKRPGVKLLQLQRSRRQTRPGGVDGDKNRTDDDNDDDDATGLLRREMITFRARQQQHDQLEHHNRGDGGILSPRHRLG